MSVASPARTVLSFMLALIFALVGVVGLRVTEASAAEGPAVLTPRVSAASSTGLTIDVTGSNYDPSAPGVYVSLGKTGLTGTAAYVTTNYVANTTIGADGSFTTQLTLDAAEVAALDSAQSYSVVSVRAHGFPDATGTQYRDVPVPLDFSVLQPTTPEPEPDPETVAPSVSVSQTSVSSVGSTVVTVTGKNFDPAAATGTRPPLAGKPGGAYVVFGKFAEVWKPSAGAASSARVNSSQKWAVSAADVATVGGAAGGAIELKADGSFTAEVTIDKAAIDAKATAASLVNYGIYTYPGSGAVQASYETYTPITFAEGAAVTATVTASSPAGLTIDVAGKHFSQSEPGVYVSLAEAGTAPADSSGYLVTTYVAHTQISAGGVFSTQLSLTATQAAALDPARSYAVYTQRAHGVPDPDGSQSTQTPVEIDFASLVKQAPSVTVSQTSVPSEGSTVVTVTGTGFDPSLATGTRPPFAGQPGGAYVVFGKFADVWKPSAGAASSVRKIVEQKWALPAGQFEALAPAAVELKTDGSFTARLTLSKAAADAIAATGTYGIYTYAGSGATVAAYETATPITFTEPVAGANITAAVTSASPSGLEIMVAGTGYAQAFPGIYVSLGKTGLTGTSSYVTSEYVDGAAMGTGGTFTQKLTLDAAAVAALDPTQSYSIVTIKAHGFPDPLLTQYRDLPLTLDFGVLQPGGPTSPTDPTDPATPTTPTNPGTGSGTPVGAGYLTWGVDAGFRSYITGPVAKGSISLAGATEVAGAYRFTQGATTSNGPDGIGTTSFRGMVAFSGHAGALALTLSDPQVAVDSTQRATLSVVVNGARIPFADLDLTRAGRTTSAGTVGFSKAPATLTAAGASAFSGFYAAGKALDPVSFIIGSASTAPIDSTLKTIASAPATVKFAPPATPVATSGLAIEGAPEAIRAGDALTVSGDGFRPNESGIKVVVYSTPIVLEEDLTADADGRATWSGLLPSSLEPGEHTVTFQGSVSRGVVFTVVEDDEIGVCPVDDASFSWGVKESFRSYVSGSIANGDWTTSGNATYATPVFTFVDGDGDFDAAASEGEVDFTGTIRFTGHAGALDTTFTDPTVRFVDSGTAFLVVDVATTSRDAAEAGGSDRVVVEDVPFAELDLSAAEPVVEGGTTTYTAVPAELTSQGNGVFTSYAAGEALDPFDLTVTSSCASVEASDDVTTITKVPSVAIDGDDDGTPWAWIGLGAGVVLVAAGLGVALARSRRTAA